MSNDVFRPDHEPARTFYDALIQESKKRDGRNLQEWIDAERQVMWGIARDYAQQNYLQVPTLAEIKREENGACGHVDYAAKWAYGIVRLLGVRPVFIR